MFICLNFTYRCMECQDHLCSECDRLTHRHNLHDRLYYDCSTMYPLPGNFAVFKEDDSFVLKVIGKYF